ncbi:IS3509a transposase [Bifidobacterium lemurum]|uniref:IS3509a transposase n=1 Tax=Bifidobacterium lemurum TaxID=1603886 RepID=A0A261FJL6_9BIFI|nr:hypothetical protein [Bifidobacterium lemurum]OZG59268.1 IS3509a transposase [Bifidobacterium lemurum]QOL34508.1 hypothetical protein BL8807_00800 [Bifidobacterium lemurum]
MRKKGFTSAGRQRWHCDRCRAGTVAQRVDLTRMAEFRAFLAWITGRSTAAQAAAGLGVSRRTFARRVAWCWNVRPSIATDGAVCHVVETDGTYAHGWCMLIAVDGGGEPLGWQWCDAESRAAYRRLFGRIPMPDVLVADGGAGCLAAAGDEWPDARVQRCLVFMFNVLWAGVAWCFPLDVQLFFRSVVIFVMI